MGLKIRGIFLLALLAGCIVMILPTIQAYRPGGNPSAIRNKVNLGLDLQGGMYLDLAVDTHAAVTQVEDRLAQEIEDAFLDKLIDYVSVERQGAAVDVVLPPSETVDWNAAPFERMLTGFTLHQVEPHHYRITMPDAEAKRIQQDATKQAVEVIRNRIDSLGVSEPSIQRKGESEIIVQLPGLRDRQQAIQTIGTQAVLAFYLVEDNVTPETMDPNKDVVKYEEQTDETTGQVIRRIPYVLEKRPVLTGDTVSDARVQISSLDNTPYVSITFNSLGTDRFARITTRSQGRRLAIVLDNKVQSAPVIREPITGGQAQISGRFTLKEATKLAIVLRSGALPAPLTIREERSVGASLGEDSIRQGLLSFIAGALLVMIFMIIYYKVSGVFANVALTLNVLLILVALASFQATLTLPGIAGIVLTMGMAVDANVLIFERIREELDLGKNARAAVNEGFQRAFWTIFDSNLTTLFAGLALLLFGTGPIRGFAVTLSIGILSSMFTAIFVTRFLYDVVYLNRRRLAEVSI
ncbi:MAG TPA: protein translocase subunit SecD [bacterium]|nr:protein translocase subunit SecD [bacterium]